MDSLEINARFHERLTGTQHTICTQTSTDSTGYRTQTTAHSWRGQRLASLFGCCSHLFLKLAKFGRVRLSTDSAFSVLLVNLGKVSPELSALCVVHRAFGVIVYRPEALLACIHLVDHVAV